MEQQDLVVKAAAGDRDAFAMLATSHVDRCYALAYRILRDPHRAQDASQQALLGAWRDLPTLRDPERFDAWLQRVAVNAARQTYRARRRRGVREIAMSRMPIATDPAGDARLDPAQRADALALDTALPTLPIEQREILVLHHLEGLSTDDLADRLSIPPGTVKSRLFTARKALQAALDREASR